MDIENFHNEELLAIFFINWSYYSNNMRFFSNEQDKNLILKKQRAAYLKILLAEIIKRNLLEKDFDIKIDDEVMDMQVLALILASDKKIFNNEMENLFNIINFKRSIYILQKSRILNLLLLLNKSSYKHIIDKIFKIDMMLSPEKSLLSKDETIEIISNVNTLSSIIFLANFDTKEIKRKGIENINYFFIAIRNRLSKNKKAFDINVLFNVFMKNYIFYNDGDFDTVSNVLINFIESKGKLKTKEINSLPEKYRIFYEYNILKNIPPSYLLSKSVTKI